MYSSFIFACYTIINRFIAKTYSYVNTKKEEKSQITSLTFYLNKIKQNRANQNLTMNN
jgi:hypothetical protein